MYLTTNERGHNGTVQKPIGYQGFAAIIENEQTGTFFPAFFSAGSAGGEMALIGLALGMTVTPTKGHTFTLAHIHQAGFGTLDEARAAIEGLNKDEKTPLNLPADRMFVDSPIQMSWQGGASELQIRPFIVPKINRHAIEAAILGVEQPESIGDTPPEFASVVPGVSRPTPRQVSRSERKLSANAARVPLKPRFAD